MFSAWSQDHIVFQRCTARNKVFIVFSIFIVFQHRAAYLSFKPSSQPHVLKTKAKVILT